MTDFTIRQLNPDDWETYRDIRLEALAKHPAFFSPSRDESKFSELDWRERLSNKNAASFGLFSGKAVIGLTGIFLEKNNPDSFRAYLVSSYIKEPFRKLGLSRLFYEARIAWARAQKNVKSLVLEHRDDNLPSQNAHRKYGFQLVNSYEQKWPDGQFRPCLVYQLDL